jgi:phenylalanyl-tRNA synthetase alpha chain
MWDTFWLKDIGLLLRTHTSPMQARYMEKHNPPLRIIVPGRCFRHEATDATHDVQFYQFEGLMVGKNVSAANFKAIIEEFFKQFFSSDVEVRLRPSYFPFVEPGFEVDVKRKGKDWLEIMGAGMVHPNVFKAVGYIPNKWQGFAFGAGLERLAMIKYQIDDIRLFFNSDLRFLKQF